MAFDVSPFLTPPPGPYQYRSPAAVSAAGAIKDREERARASNLAASVQREGQEAANRREAERNALELWKFQVGQEDKSRKEFDALLTEFGTALRNGDEAAANEVAQRMRAHGAQAVRVGGPQPSQQAPQAEAPKTPAGGAEQKPSTPPAEPEADYSYSGLKPMPGVRPMPVRAMPPGGPSAVGMEQAQWQRNKAAALGNWLAMREGGTGLGLPAPAYAEPTPVLGGAQTAERLAKTGAFQTQRALGAQPQAPQRQAQAPSMGGMVSPMNAGVRPGWVVRKRGQEVFRIADTDVSRFRGQSIGQHFGPRMTEGTPDQKAAAKVAFDVASNAGGLPTAEAIQEGEKAYNAEMDRMAAAERAATMARSKAAVAAGGQEQDATKLRIQVMSGIATRYKTPMLMEESRQVRNILELMNKPGAMQNGTTASFALTRAIKAYGDSRITDTEYRLAADAPGLTSKMDSILKWFKGEGRISDEVFRNTRTAMFEQFKSLTSRLQSASQEAYNQMNVTSWIPPAIRETEARAAATGVYQEWVPQETGPQLEAAPKRSSGGGRAWDKFRGAK